MRTFQPIISIIIIYFLLCSSESNAQQWEKLNPPLNPFNEYIYSSTVDASGNIYCGGDFKNSNSVRFVAKWQDTSWIELGSGSSSLNANGSILSLASYSTNIYAAGAFSNNSMYTYVAKWNGVSWSELGSGDKGLNANDLIYSIAVDKSGNVYAAGRFTNAADKCYVAKWDGANWKELGIGSGALNANNAIFAITTDMAGNVYAGGYFTNAAGKEYVAKWDGTSWKEVGIGSEALNANDFIRCLGIDPDGDLYAAGNFRNTNNEYYVAKWVNSHWIEVGTTPNNLKANDAIASMVIKNTNEIYAAGFFSDVVGNHFIAKWDGNSWSEINSPEHPLIANDAIESIQIDNTNNLFAAGKFTNKSGNSFIAKWDGNGWNEPGSRGNPFNLSPQLYKLVGDSVGIIYISGKYLFDNGGKPYLERWNGSGWDELMPADSTNMVLIMEANKINGKNCLYVDRSGNLLALGSTHNSAVPYPYYCILKWDKKNWSVLEDFPNSLDPISITDMEMDKNDNIYLSGEFNDSVSAGMCIAKWDGHKWSKLPITADYIENFCVTNDGNIYAYGSFKDEYGRSIIVKYNLNTGYNWEEVRNGNSRFNAPGANVFYALATDDENNLYVNGNFVNTDGKGYLAKWDGKAWTEFGTSNMYNRYALLIDSNAIYTYIVTNDKTESNLKKWVDTSWVSVGEPIETGALGGSLLATDIAGNLYSDAYIYEPRLINFIAKYTNTPPKIPSLSSFSPISGSTGTKVTIIGKSLTGSTLVSFGGTSAKSFTINNDSTIIAIVGKGATGSIKVSTSAGSDSLSLFTYTCDSVQDQKPTITSIGDSILISSKASYYRWFLNNRILDNKTSDSIGITNTGFYHVETSSNNICWVTSLDYPVLIDRSSSTDSIKMVLYPNPSSGNFTVQVKLPQATTVTTYTTVYDINGNKVLQTNKLIFFGNEIKIPITINNKGTYFIKVFVNDDSVQQTIIIQ